MEEPTIESIYFPNTATDEWLLKYVNGKEGVTIERVYKNGEMSAICWFAIKKDGKLIAEIKESICHIYYQ